MYTKEQLSKYPYFEEVFQSGDASNVVDSLTGLVSRRYMVEFIQHLVDNRVPFTLALLDLDNFKFINDTYGHSAGDDALQTVASVLRRLQWNGAVSARIGGDEFVAFLTEEDEDGLRRLLKELNKSMAQNDANVSVGYSYRNGNVSAEEQMSEADDAMYAEKLIYRKLHSKR